MVTIVSTKCQSLVEQKRVQWAKEREELAGLCAPWGRLSTRIEDNYRTCIRTRFVSSTTDQTPQENEEVRQSYDYPKLTAELQAAASMMRRRRSPNLPPIYSRTSPSCQDEELARGSHPYENNPEPEDEGEGETSGYASDSGGMSNERNTDYWNQHRQERIQRHDNWMSDNQIHDKASGKFSKQTPWIPSNRRYGTPDSVVSTPPHRMWSCGASDEVNRLQWGDRGVGVGHFWEPAFHEPDSRLPQVQTSGRGTPGWLERGLNKLSNSNSSTSSSTQVLVINHGSPDQSNISRELADSCDTISTQSQSECNKTFIRGQNAPLEPEILLERERKRRKALEHQNAIRLQLEERERKRKEEKERRIKEERQEEERIKHEREIERKRIEEEQRRLKEREDKEVRKAAAMRKALEYAEKKAREDKSLASRKHMVESVKSSVITDTCHNKSWFDSNSAESSATDNTTLTTQNSTEIKDSVTDLCSTTVSSNSSISVPTENEELLKINDGTQTGIETHNDALLIAAETVTVPADGLAVVLGNAAEGRPHEILPTSSGGVQFALLMSPSLHQPLMLDKRLLTPSKYRPIGHEQGTQTDLEVMKGRRSRWGKDKADNQITRKDRKKSASLERPHRGCKLPLRCRSQSQPTEPRMRLEDRPKWGVNRPGTQYIKQSEKDPYYQRRLKQRLLKAAMMGGGDTGTESDTGSRRRNCHTRGSSDENSRSPSPQQSSYHFSNGTNKRIVYHHHRTRNLDRNTNKFSEEEDKLLVPSVNDEQLESKIVLFRNRSYNVDTPSKPVQVDISSPNIIENTMNRDSTQQNTSNHIMSSNILHNFSVKGSRRLLNRQNEIPITVSSNTKEQWSRAKDILSQLSSLRQGLLIKQQEWELTRSHTPQSESSWNS